MKRKVLSLLLALAMVLNLGFISETSAESRSTEQIIEDMSVREKIAQMLMVEFRYWQQEGETEKKEVDVLNPEIKEAIEKYKFGGVILFAQNVKETEQTLRLTDQLQKAAIESGNLPLLLSIDQEGGKVVRLGTGTSLPGNMALGATRDPQSAYRYGQIIGEELKSLGINVNLAPVADVNNNPNNPVIGERSISSRPELVAEMTSNVTKGLQDTGISAAAKHFPGHGDTATDSHVGLPIVDKSKEDVMALEVYPFNYLANEGIDMIMTAHISYPQIEQDKAISKLDGSEINIPATLSDDILTGLVRNEMNYDGIIITDALNMKAISDHFGEEEATLMSLKAGSDILLMPTKLENKADLEKLDTIIDNIEEAVNNGEVTEERLNESVRRIVELKRKRGILELDQYNQDIDARIQNALNLVGSREHLDDQRTITQKAITVGINNDNSLPLYPTKDESVLLLGAYDNEVPGLVYGFTRLQREGAIPEDTKYEAFRFNENTTREELKSLIDKHDYVVVISEIAAESRLAKDHWLSRVPTDVTELAKEANKKSVVLSIAKPYDLGRYKDADAMVLAYGAKGMDPTEPGQEPSKTFGPNIPTSLDIIFGKVASSGKLPVDVPKLSEDFKYTDETAYEFGYGLVTKLKEDTPLTPLEPSIPDNLHYEYELLDVELSAVHEDLPKEVNKAFDNFDYKVIDLVVKNSEGTVLTELDEPLEIRIDLKVLGLENNLDESTLKIWTNHNGELEEIKEFKLEEDSIVFERAKFSSFAFVHEVKKETETEVETETENETKDTTNETEKPEKNDKTDKKGNNPKTGDNGVTLQLAVLVLSASALYIMINKKKKYNN